MVLGARNVPRRPGGSPDGGAAGMVTAEIAVGLPALVVVLGCCLWLLTAVTTQLQCADVAREVARALARDEPDGAVRARAAAEAPPGATVTVSREGELIRVTVTARRAAGAAGVHLPAVTVRGTATAAAEPGVTP